ncbi:MAG: T9SS type A sorting domain-containing protein [Salinibacter sp.]
MRTLTQLLFLFALFALPAQAQTNLLDNYDRSDNNSLGMTPTSPKSLSWVEKSEDTGEEVRIENNAAHLTSDGSGGVKSAVVDMTTLSSYPVPLNTADSTVTWAFNVRPGQTELTGFASGKTGVMFVLAGTSNDIKGAANAYAVIIGSPDNASTNQDSIKVVRFNGGYSDNGELTPVTSGIAGVDSDYRSIRVTYNPTGNEWSLYAAASESSFPFDNPLNVPDSNQLGSTTADSGGPVGNSSAKFLGLHYNHGNDSTVDAIFDDVYITDPGGELPVELATFDATADGEAVHLRWKTASETGNAGFEVQRATENGFETLGFVEGAGTTTEATRYTYTAEGLSPGRYTFRLKQVDLDGSTSLGPERTVTLRPQELHLATTGPNPVQEGGQAAFRVTTNTEQVVTVTLHDVLGRTVRTIYDGRVGPNGRNLSVPVSTLSNGIYFVRAQGSSETTTRRITVTQ